MAVYLEAIDSETSIFFPRKTLQYTLIKRQLQKLYRGKLGHMLQQKSLTMYLNIVL